jgi:hypothetical protein
MDPPAASIGLEIKRTIKVNSKPIGIDFSIFFGWQISGFPAVWQETYIFAECSGHDPFRDFKGFGSKNP